MDILLVRALGLLGLAILDALAARRVRLTHTVGLVFAGAALALFRVATGLTLTHDLTFGVGSTLPLDGARRTAGRRDGLLLPKAAPPPARAKRWRRQRGWSASKPPSENGPVEQSADQGNALVGAVLLFSPAFWTFSSRSGVAPRIKNERGRGPRSPTSERMLWVDQAVADRLSAIRGPGESYSDLILRLIAGERRRADFKRLWSS
jgi:hypothetical protein